MDNENNNKEPKKTFEIKTKPTGSVVNKADIQKTLVLKRTVARKKLKSGDVAAGSSGNIKTNFGNTLKLKLKSISDSTSMTTAVKVEDKVEDKAEKI